MSAPLKTGWHCASVCGQIAGILAFVLLATGLGLQSVMHVQFSQPTIVSIIPPVMSEISYDFTITYFGVTAKVKMNGEERELSDGSLDEATCGMAAAVKAGAAFHFLAMFACVPMVLVFVLDRDPKRRTTPVTNLPLATLIAVNVFLGIQMGVLQMARSKASHDNCDTVPPGLVRYAVGGCWICAGVAEVLCFIAGLVYLAQRYCKCCCYNPTNAAALEAADSVDTRPTPLLQHAGEDPASQKQPASMPPNQTVLPPSTSTSASVTCAPNTGYQSSGGIHRSYPQQDDDL